MRYLFLMTLLLIATHSYTQKPNTNNKLNSTATPLEAELLFYGDVMVNASEASSRIRAAEKFSSLFTQFIEKTDSLSQHDFLKYTSKIDAPDGRFSLITWQIQKENYVYDFKGYILFDSGKSVELQRTEPLSTSTAYQTSTTDDWYGCMYYNIKQTDTNEYLLFGFDSNTKYDNLKLIDVLTITGDDIVFGKEIFEDHDSPETYVNRIIISYTSDAAVNLNYSPGLDIILQDHLESTIGLQAGQGSTNVPDGTYVGYVEENGKWMFKNKIYDHVYEKAPRPKPVFNETPEAAKKVKMK